MTDLTAQDIAVPGGVYLCQVKPHVSCGACCGLYNVEDAGKDRLTEILSWRTRRFSEIPRTVDAILAFTEEVRRRESQARPYQDFHHCPFIGMVGEEGLRVGCLLHPLADGNAGIDFRGLSYYGGMACRTYFCPATKEMKPACKQILRAVAEDWHAYGLIITETALVASFFQIIERRISRPLAAGDILGCARREELVRSFIEMRRSWPFRSEPDKLCNYFFEDRKYPKNPVDHQASNGIAAGAYEVLFRELESSFASEQDAAAAVRMIDELVERLVREIRRLPRKSLPGG